MKKLNEPEHPPCLFEIRTENNTVTMKILCKECGQKDLKDRDCFSSLLRAFAKEVNVDRIVLSNHAETQYFGKALSILKDITALSYEMRQLSLRVPSVPSGIVPEGCSDCQYRPDQVFTHLNEQFLKDVGTFYSLFHDMTVRLYDTDIPDRACGECFLSTREDFDYIYGRFNKLLHKIIKEEYTVVK